MIMGHGIYTPGQFITNDMCDGYSLFMSSYNIPNLDVKNSVWMLMACYGGFIKDMKNTEDSNIMQFLKNGGAVYFGGTLTQFTSATIPLDCDAFGVPGGDALIGTLYALIVKEFSINKRIGDSFIQGKFKYGTTIPDEGGCRFRVGHQTLLYGDPTLKIKNM